MALPRAKLGVSLFRHPCRKPPFPRERLCMLCWLCVLQSPWAYTPGIHAGAILLGLPPLVQARMLAVSRTKPLHVAVAQMADDLYGGFAPNPIFDNNKVFFDRLSRRRTACLNNHRTSQFIMPKTDIFAKSLSVLSQAVSSELSLPVSPPPKSPCNASNIANFIS